MQYARFPKHSSSTLVFSGETMRVFVFLSTTNFTYESRSILSATPDKGITRTKLNFFSSSDPESPFGKRSVIVLKARRGKHAVICFLSFSAIILRNGVPSLQSEFALVYSIDAWVMVTT